MNSIANKVKEIVSDILKFDINGISRESVLIEDFMADDLDIAEIAEAIEDEFNISISCSAIDNIITFRDLVDYVSCALNNKENNTMCKKYVIHERQLNMLKSIYNAYKECGLHNYWLEDIISDIEKQEIVDEDSSEDIK